MEATKISLVVLDSLAIWQKLNVASFLASAIAIACPETHGKRFVDASGQDYLAILRQPVLVYRAKNATDIRSAYMRARKRDLQIGIYPEPLLATKKEYENHEIISSTAEDEHDLIGLVVYGSALEVDRAFRRLRLHA